MPFFIVVNAYWRLGHTKQAKAYGQKTQTKLQSSQGDLSIIYGGDGAVCIALYRSGLDANGIIWQCFLGRTVFFYLYRAFREWGLDWRLIVLQQ